MRILLGVTGSIACFKAAKLTSLFSQRHWDVRVVLTKNALQFIQPLTFEYLSGHPVALPEISPCHQEDHIALAEWCEMFLIAPATANILGKLAAAIADDMLSTIALALPKETPKFLAPAMNQRMYTHPLVQKNLKTLQEIGYHLIPPSSGHLACGHEGKGRMAEPEEILKVLEQHIQASST